MKTDREFLDGIYEKAKLLEMESVETQEKSLPSRRALPLRRILIAAAAVFLIAIPGMFYFNQPKMEIPKGYENNTPMKIRMYMAVETEGLMETSDVICTAKVTKIQNSEYAEDNQSIITKIQVKPTEVLKGELESAELTVKVNGGFDKATKTYVEYDAVFTRGEEVLLFLLKDADGSYTLSGASQGKYTLLEKSSAGYAEVAPNDTIYAGLNGETITLSKLKEELVQQKQSQGQRLEE